MSDASSGAPLGAAVTIGAFEVASDPGTGFYSLQLPSGTYDVTASADGYVPATALDVALADLETVTVDLALEPLVPLLEDDVEAGNIGWTVEAPWAITDEAANSPTHSWTDSPGADYGDNVDSSLTSPEIDLTGFSGTLLSFRHIYDFESGFDNALVEVSTDGSSWTTVRGFSQENQTAAWILEEVPLPMLDGVATARFRFRVDTDGSVTEDGWHVDDVRLEAAAANISLIFTDGFESGDTASWSSATPP